MQVIGYTRVSTTEQATDGVSLAAQHAKIKAYAVVKDWTVLEVIRDEGASTILGILGRHPRPLQREVA
jgi:site-specific DNA recombinase